MAKMEMPDDGDGKDKESPAEDAGEALGFSEQIARLSQSDQALFQLLVARFNEK